ncbi:hypothetical protein ACFU96_47490 [Streptomyces sp. NPDC057620]|uniref:hypothetical protein n=1 Tax=Streptomyces sp. NPDC057620 TaxID=3346185 RepID=UPI00368C2FFD
MSTPTAAQAAALALLAEGAAHRLEHSGTWYIVAHDGTTLSKTTVTSLTKRGWAAYGDLVGVRRPLTLTDAGHGVVSALAADK